MRKTHKISSKKVFVADSGADLFQIFGTDSNRPAYVFFGY
jgi:hypothetical protein